MPNRSQPPHYRQGRGWLDGVNRNLSLAYIEEDMMSLKKLLPRMIGLTLVMLLLAACGTSQPASTPDPPMPTPIPPTNTPLLPTPTPNPPTATPLPPTLIPPTVTPSPPPSETPVPPVALTTAEDLVSVWRREDRLQIFTERGTYLSFFPGNWSCPGRFWFEGNQLHAEDTSDNCCPAGQIGIYEVLGVPQDYFEFTRVSDQCEGRKGFFRGTWEWVTLP